MVYCALQSSPHCSTVCMDVHALKYLVYLINNTSTVTETVSSEVTVQTKAGPDSTLVYYTLSKLSVLF